MLSKLFDVNPIQSNKQRYNNATAQRIELKEIKKQTAINALPFDVMSIDF